MGECWALYGDCSANMADIDSIDSGHGSHTLSRHSDYRPAVRTLTIKLNDDCSDGWAPLLCRHLKAPQGMTQRSEDTRLLPPSSEFAGEQPHSATTRTQGRCSCISQRQLQLPWLGWWVQQWLSQSLPFLFPGGLHLVRISVRCYFHQVGERPSVVFRRRHRLLDLKVCIPTSFPPSPSSFPPRVIHFHLRAHWSPYQLPSKPSPPPSRSQSLPSMFSVQVTPAVTPLSPIPPLPSIAAKVLQHVGGHPFSITDPSFFQPSPIDGLSALGKRTLSNSSGCDPISFGELDPLAPQSYAIPSPTGSLSPLPYPLSPYPFTHLLHSPGTGGSQWLQYLSSLGKSGSSLSTINSESRDNPFVDRGMSFLASGEGEESGGIGSDDLSGMKESSTALGPHRPRAARELLPDSPQSQSHLHPQSASAAAQQFTSSAVDLSSSPQFGWPNDRSSMRYMPKSPFNDLPAAAAAGVSVAASDCGQPQSPTVASWLTLPQLRERLTKAVEVDVHPQEGDPVQQRPSITLGFQQAYPITNGNSQPSYLVIWPGVGAHQGPVVTLESPFKADPAVANPFFSSYPQEVERASTLLEPNPTQLHLVDVLFDMARINPSLAAILPNIPYMNRSQLGGYQREVVEVIPGRRPDYGRFGERVTGSGIIVQLHVEVLTVRELSSYPVPPPEPVVFFTNTRSDHPFNDTTQIAHPILLPPPFISNPLFTTAQRERCYPYEQRASVLSLASVTFHQLRTASTTDVHWRTATHNINSLESDVMTVFSTSKESRSSPPSSDPRTYRYLSNELNDLSTLSSSSTHSKLREQNLIRIWRIVRGYFHKRSTHQLPAQPTAEESTLMRLFIDSFLASVSHESGWLPANINKWCLGAQSGTNTPFAVSRLCEAMQLQSAMSDVAQLRQIHMQQQLTPEEGQSFSESGDSAAVSRQCMKNIARAVNAAFSPSVAGADTPSEAVSTPMELINLVIWQSQKQPEGLPAAQQCLQLLQSQLGKGVDRSTLLQWLSDVRTFSLDDTTGELRQDPNSQWVTSLIKEEIVLPSTSEGTGQRKCSHPPALLIGPPLASGDEAHLQQGHSGQVEYHLLQMVHEHEDSPLHSRYSSSLSNLALSPMVPFISENAGTDGACRLYFLPVLGIQQVEPAIPLPITSTLSGDWDCHSGSLLELGLRVQLRCGDAVQLSPRLCSQLGSSCCGPRWDFESGQASAERDESQQLMTFFGALLMVGPGASDTTGTAEVWALLSDSLCRWWVYRVNLSSPLHKAPSLTGEAGQSQEPRIALHHLFGPSAKEGSAHQAGIDPQLSMTLWQGRCQEVWKAVLGWLHFAGDRVVPPPRRPPVMPPERSESLRPLLPKKAVNKPASAQRGGLHATQKAQRAAAKEGASNDSAPVVRPQMEEQKDGEEVHFTDIPEGPRRSSRHAHPPGDAVHELATDKRSGGEEEEMEDGTRKEDKEAAKKAKDKAAKQKAKLAAQKQKERDTEREQEEKERERKKETKNGKKERREPSKKQKKKAQRTPKSKKRERSKKREKPVDSAKKPNKRPRISQDSEVRAQPAEVAKGVLTRMRASAESTSAVSKQPAVVAKKRGGKGRGKKRKGTAHEEEKDIVTVEEWEDSEENIVESTNASTERAPPTSAQPSSQTSHPASSPSATSGSSSTPQPHSPAASGDEVGTTAVKSHDNQAKGAQISREGQAPSLWCVYMSGEEGLALPHKDKVNRWFEHGLHKVPMFSASDPHRRDDLSGPNVDVFEEWDFVLQTRIRKRHPENVVPLQRSRRPPNACLAQCFVASVGFYDKDVQNGYHDAVTAHRKLTDAYASKQNRTAVHIDLLANPPWEKFKGITLTTMTGDRMNECGTLIDNDTPSWPLNQYPSLDTFRAGLARIHRAQQERKEEHLPSPTPQKKIKTAKESASVMEWGDRHHRHAYGGGPSHTIRTKTEQKMDHQQAAYYEALRAQARASVAVSSSMGPSNLSVVSDTDSRSPSPFHQPLRSTNGPGRVGIFNAPVQFVASPQADGVIDLERTSSSARRKGTEGAPQFVFFTPVAAPHSAQPGGYSNYMNPSYFPPHPQPPTPPMQPGPYQVSYVPVQQSLPPQPTYAVGHPAPHVSHSLPYHPYQHQMAVAQLPSGFLIP